MPDKSLWYLVDYDCIQVKWKCTNPGQEKVPEATNKTGEILPLQYLHTNESMPMLEMYLALYEKNKYQVE